MPDIVIQAWQAIWKMTPEDLGGKRTYRADFEIYDQRAQDPQNSVVDIYIGTTQQTYLVQQHEPKLRLFHFAFNSLA